MSFNELRPYVASKYHSKFFHHFRSKFEDFYESERYFLTKDIIKQGMAILDIGCASGGLGAAIRDKVEAKIQYTGIDIDRKAIDLGKQDFSGIELIHGKYPEDVPKRKFDMIILLNLFEQIAEWKNFLLSLTGRCNKFINIGLILRMTGPTIIDKDVSYGYYHDSGVRVHKIIHNIFEFVNFCCIEEMRVKKISFYGYCIDRAASAAGDFRPLPQKEQIRGNMLLELYEDGKNIKRVGGFINDAAKEFDLDYPVTVRPEMEIIVDKKHIEL